MTGAGQVRVLVADDEASLIEDYQYALIQPQVGRIDQRLAELHDELFGPISNHGNLPEIDLVTVRQGRDAVEQVRRALEEARPFSAAFIDVRMPPGVNGVDTAAQIRAIDEHLQIVIVTAYTDLQTIDLVEKVPPAHRLFVLQKPFHAIEIQQLAVALTSKWESERQGATGYGFRRGDAFPVGELLLDLPGGTALFDADDRLIEVNGEMRMLFPQLDDLLQPGTPYRSIQMGIEERLLPEEFLRRKDKWGSGRTIWNLPGSAPVERRFSDNRWFMIVEHAVRSGGQVVQFLDVSALKLNEQRRAMANGMVQISRMAGTLVDRIGAIVPGANEAAGDDDRTAAGKALIDDLIPLAQRQPLAPVAALPDAIVGDVARDLEMRVPNGVALEIVSTVGLWPIFVDVAQLKAALRALVGNAVEALRGPGRIVLETSNVRIAKTALPDLPGLKSGDYVRISVNDNGPGMLPELIERSVLPFFTSKDPSAHAGMGLSAAYAFVSQSGGYLDIESDGKSGTTVNLYFPRAIGVAASSGTNKKPN
ncbi:MAG: ATP-binding protein [Kiloniellales bacterium]